MNFNHVAGYGRAAGSDDAALIGGLLRVGQIEIVAEMLMCADKQEQTTAGGQALEHEQHIPFHAHAGLSSIGRSLCRTR